MGLRNSSTAIGEEGGVYRAHGGAVESAAGRESVAPRRGADGVALGARPRLGVAARVLLGVIRIYQLTFSPFGASPCKFYPTCSHYGAGAIRAHGARRGAWLALRRVLRCHPFSPGGFDPVPDAGVEESESQRGERP